MLAIDRDRLLELLEEGAQLVEVLPAAEYELLHLPGAVSLPLKDFSRSAARELLSPQDPVVTYCNGFT